MQTPPQPQTRLRAVLEAGQKRHARAFNKQQPPSATTGKYLYKSNVPVVHAELLLGDVDQNGKPFLENEDNPRSIEYTMSYQYPDGRPMISQHELYKLVKELIAIAETEEKVIVVNYGRVPESDLHEVYNPKKASDLQFETLHVMMHDMLEKEWPSLRGPIVYLK